MKIVAISDIHTKQKQLKLPEGDVLVCAGDLSFRGTIQEISEFSEWLKQRPHKYKVVIAGNHDWGFETNRQLFQKMIEDAGGIYLENSGVTIECVKFWGSPITPRFFDWAFNVDRGSLIKQYWDQIPIDTDVLITHGPAHGFGDYVDNHYSKGLNVGCQDLYDAIERVKPQVHFYGHIHEGYGRYKMHCGTVSVNCSVVNSRYWVTNDPMIFDLTGPKNPVAS
jgi:Icc-related predicted phosphoesterase